MKAEFHCEKCGEVVDFGQFVSLVSGTYLTFEDNENNMYLIIHRDCQDSLSVLFDNSEIVDSTKDLLLVHVWDNIEDEE